MIRRALIWLIAVWAGACPNYVYSGCETAPGGRICRNSCCLSKEELTQIYSEGQIAKNKLYGSGPIIVSRWADKKTDELTKRALSSRKEDKQNFFNYYVQAAKTQPANAIAGPGLYVSLPTPGTSEIVSQKNLISSSATYASAVDPSLFFLQVDSSASVLDMKALNQKIKSSLLRKGAILRDTNTGPRLHFFQCCVEVLKQNGMSNYIINNYDSAHPSWGVIGSADLLQSYQPRNSVIPCQLLNDSEIDNMTDSLAKKAYKKLIPTYLRSLRRECNSKSNIRPADKTGQNCTLASPNENMTGRAMIRLNRNAKSLEAHEQKQNF